MRVQEWALIGAIITMVFMTLATKYWNTLNNIGHVIIGMALYVVWRIIFTIALNTKRP